MSDMACSKGAEIDRNLERFVSLLPSLIAEHNGEYVLMRKSQIIDLFSDRA